MSEVNEEGLVLVARKGGGFGLPTACPSCLPVYIYLRLANAPFQLQFDLANPDSDHVPYIENGDSVLFNNEKGGVIECLKGENIVDLDSTLPSASVPDWLATKALISSWLEEAVQYELWVASDGTSSAKRIYFSDLPWPVGKILQWKNIRVTKQQLGITSLNADAKEQEIHRKAGLAYEALSHKLGDQTFFFDNRPTSVDATFLAHALFVLYALPDTSSLRNILLQHDTLVGYAEKLKAEYLDSSSSSSVPRSSAGPSTSSTQRRKSSYWGSKPQPKAKREKTEEEKTFRKRGKLFLAAQFVAVLVFLSVFGAQQDDLEDYEGPGYDD